MKLIRATITAVCMAGPAAALADEADQAIRRALGIFSEGVTNLSVDGYTQIKMVDWQRNRFSAYDANGSEVLITIDPDQGTLIRLDYVHMTDW